MQWQLLDGMIITQKIILLLQMDILLKKDGAYILLNSWEEDAGENGYVYVSYEDYGVHSLVNGVISTSDEKLINLSNINNKPLVDAIKEKYKQYVIYKNDKYYVNKNTLQIIGNFDLSNSDITSLEGIELFDSVYEIDLSNNKITDIDKLKDFTNLDNLNLSNNKIKDVSVLKNNKQLRILNLENNIDVKGYGEISSLYNLNLKNCNVQNLDELENLRKLNGITQLNIINNTSENNEDTIIEQDIFAVNFINE